MDAPPPMDPARGPLLGGPPPVSNAGRGGVPRWVVAVGLGGVGLAAVGAAAVALVLAPKPTQAIDRMVPASADGYVAAYLDPPLSQKLNLLGLAHRFPDLKTDADIRTSVDRWLDKAFETAGLSFSQDVRPWLGSQVDFIAEVQSTTPEDKTPPVALLAVSKDDARARAALGRLRTGSVGQPMAWSEESYQGIPISVGTPSGNAIKEPLVYAVVDHTVVLASSEPLVRAIIDADAGKRPRLIDSPDFRTALGRVPADKLVFAYLNGRAAARTVTSRLSGAKQNPLGADPAKYDQLAAAQIIAFAVVAKPNGLVADLEVKVDPSRLDAASRNALTASGNAASMAGWIPKRAYGFVATVGLKASLTALVETFKSDRQTAQQLDGFGITGANGVLAHLTGEAALEVEPGRTRYPGGAVLIGTNDRPGMERFLQRLTDTLAPLSQGLTQGSSPGVTVHHTTYHAAVITTLGVGDLGGAGYAPSYTVTQGFAIIGSSLAEVEAVINAHETGVTIATSDRYKAAVGQAVTNPSGLFYADIGAIATASRPLLPPAEQQKYDSKVDPYLRPITAVIMTSQGTSSSLSELVFVLITGGSS